MRRLLLLLGVLLVAGLLAPAAARASSTITVTARGTLTMWDRWDCVSPTSDPSCAQNGGSTPAARPRALYAPLAPGCQTAAPGLCGGDRARWLLGSPGDPNQPVACVVAHSASGGGPCEVSAQGTFFNSSGFGPWCGFTQGELVLEVRIGSFTEELGGSGNLHAGPFAGAWPLGQEHPPFGGEGVAVMTAVTPPGCGLSPLDGFQGTHSLDVELTFTWTDEVCPSSCA